MKRRSHLAAWLLLWLAGLVAWPLWAGPERMQQRVRAESADAIKTFGPRLGGGLVRMAEAGLHAVGGRGGDVERPRGTGFPPPDDPHVAGPGAARGVPATVVRHADRYLAALASQVHGAMLRGLSLGAWLVLLTPLWVAAVIEGLAQRAILLDELGFQSPAALALASHAFIACAMAPVIVLVLPFPLPHAFVPVWAVVILIPLCVGVTHLQPVFRR